MQREKRQRSGKLLEVDFFPVFENGRRIPTRAPKSKPTRAEQEKYNKTQSTKKCIRLVNENFNETDYFAHFTFRPECMPKTKEEANREIYNYFRRVKRRRAKRLKEYKKKLAEAKAALALMPDNDFLRHSVDEINKIIKKLSEEFKYIVVIEEEECKSGINEGCLTWHYHLFMTGGLSAKEHESMFNKGQRVRCEFFDPKGFGLDAAAVYICKNPKGKKSYRPSRNLKKPEEPKRIEGKVSRRMVSKFATERVDDAEYWEKRYKGYKFVRCYSRFNSYNSHWYVSVVMYRDEKAPPWNIDDWITEDF
ncbi:MAG: hypothetical protein ACI4RU_07565 [Acutalibacteraceae bacterium]